MCSICRKSIVLVIALLLTVATAAANRLAAGETEPARTANRSTTRSGNLTLDNLKPGEWCEVPNSRLDAVAAKQSKFPWLAGSSGVAGVICCWCGGAFDWQRNQLYIGPGGGHMGYNGNEVYAFSLRDMKWRRLNDPYPIVMGESTDPKRTVCHAHLRRRRIHSAAV